MRVIAIAFILAATPAYTQQPVAPTDQKIISAWQDCLENRDTTPRNHTASQPEQRNWKSGYENCDVVAKAFDKTEQARATKAAEQERAARKQRIDDLAKLLSK